MKPAVDGCSGWFWIPSSHKGLRGLSI